jgi:hypothetical protein
VDLALLLNVVTTGAVVVGVAFGLIELRQALRARADVAAVDIVRSVQTQEIRRAVARVLALPNDVDPEVIRSDPTLVADALAIDSACEMWGSLVYEGIADLHMLDRMVGGWVRGTWVRLRAWVNAERVDNRSPNVAEWWEWLYDMLVASPDPGKARGAHVSYKGKLRS